jgi:hypothetical protein
VSRSSRPKNRPSHANALARERALAALSRMRSGLSLNAASREAHTTAATVRRYLPTAVHRTKSGRFVASTSDQYARSIRILTAQGQKIVAVRGSRTASRIAEYWSAVDHFLKAGSTQRLWKFRGQSFQAGKVRYPFLTSPETLKRLGFAGEVQFEDLYALRG